VNVELACSFRFIDEDLNRRFLALLKRSAVRHLVDAHGTVHYSTNDAEFIENDVISAVRNRVFPSWQILSCPREWTETYRSYMIRRDIPFSEELDDRQLCFLIPRKYRPHAWRKLK
jgi:hypothetical protein